MHTRTHVHPDTGGLVGMVGGDMGCHCGIALGGNDRLCVGWTPVEQPEYVSESYVRVGGVKRQCCFFSCTLFPRPTGSRRLGCHRIGGGRGRIVLRPFPIK